jgi:hypothetical protein
MEIRNAQKMATGVHHFVNFFASCKQADVNPFAWMTVTINQIGNHPINKLFKLLLNNFRKI